MTNKTQTMLTIALTIAVTVLLVDRLIEPAQASAGDPHVLMVLAKHGGGYAFAQEFSSQANCEAGAKAYYDMLSAAFGGLPINDSDKAPHPTSCVPK